jgi:uncharacterized protein (DUF885 family)
MPKWLIILLAIAALAGVIVLEQTREPFPAVTPVPNAQGPAITPPATAPTTPQTASNAVGVPALPLPETTQPQTPSEIPSTPQTPSSVAATDGPWAGLPLGEFLGRAAGELVRLSPETVTFLGLGAQLGMRDDHLDSLTADWEAEYYALEQAIVDHLATYDLARETAEARLNAEIYRASLLNDLAGRTFSDNAYSVSSYMDSYPTYIEWFLTSLHPLETLDNADDYVSRLSEIPARFRELESRLSDSEALSAVPPRFMLEKAVGQICRTGESPVRETSFYTTLESALTAMDSVDATSATALLDRAAAVLETAVLPSYIELADFVSGMAARAADDAGVWKQVNGDEFYAYCLRSQTTTDLTADQIYDLGVAEVTRIEGEIRTAAATLGLDSTATIPELFGRLSETTGTSLGDDTIARCQAIIDDIGPRVASAFLRMPTQKLIVVDGGYDTYFSAGTLDGSRPGQFFIPTLMPEPIYDLPTTTYHEAVPGHGFQAAYAYEADIPDYIAGLSFTAFSEGWALYAERLVWEEGAYDENPYGNLGRLQDELFRAARLVLDPGIHAKRWTYEQAVDYMINNTGLEESYVRSEVERYIVTPGQAVTYKIGMLKMIELRDRAKTALGTAFNLAEFHDVVLGHGELPLDLFERLIDEYIAEHQG